MPQNTDNHAFYLTQIHQLKELQKLDDQIYEVQQILEKALTNSGTCRTN